MNLFSCSHCDNTLYFENSRCIACGSDVGFHTSHLSMVTLQKKKNQKFYQNRKAPHERLKYCANRALIDCNWLISSDNSDSFCIACQLSKTIPSLSVPENQARWRRLETAKKRLIYSLLRLRLPFRGSILSMTPGLQFEFLSNDLSDDPILTGHLNGIITINIEEADEVQRFITQVQMGESYRTVLGHFRHESGHYYWNRLVVDGGYINDFRTLFGDDENDYSDALSEYYMNGPPTNWQETHISQYACSHPWEDWAETWANYLHIMDTLETAWSFGVEVHPSKGSISNLAANLGTDPFLVADFQTILSSWISLSIAVNNLNRSMGHSDFYSFYISSKVSEKLSFIHNLCRMWREQYS